MGAPTFIGAGAVNAITLNQFQSPFGLLANVNPTEPNSQTTVRAAATVSYMGSILNANGTARVTMFRKNAADTSLSPTITDSVAGAYYDATNSVSLAVNDTFDLNLRGTAPAYIPYAVYFKHVASAGTATYYGFANETSPTTTLFMPPVTGFGTPTESQVSPTMRVGGTVSFQVVTVTTASTAAGTLISRKNGANGNLTVSVTSGATGQFSDTTNSDTISAGDKYNFQWSCASLVTKFGGTSFWQLNDDRSELPISNGAVPISFNASNQFTAFFGGVGAAPTITTTESLVQGNLGIDGTLSNLRLGVAANGMTSTFTFALRKNGVTQTNSLAIGAGTTGMFEDTTHTDNFIGTDNLNFIASGGTANTITPVTAALLLTPEPRLKTFFPFGEPWRSPRTAVGY